MLCNMDGRTRTLGPSAEPSAPWSSVVSVFSVLNKPHFGDEFSRRTRSTDPFLIPIVTFGVGLRVDPGAERLSNTTGTLAHQIRT